MLSCASLVAFAALALVAPENGATVPLLRDGQRAYFAKDAATRAGEMDAAAPRRALGRVGALPRAVEFRWTGGSQPDAELSVWAEGDEPSPFAVTNAGVAHVTNLKVATRYRWKVACGDETAEGAFVTADEAPRFLYVAGLSNARDLGGRPGLGGRRLRQGRLLRSDGLRDSTKSAGGSLFSSRTTGGEERVTSRGKVTLAVELGVRTEIELRRAREIVGFSDSVLGPGVGWRHIEFSAYDFIDDPMTGRLPFSEVFRLLLDEKNYPVLFHCSGGRDRTGTLAFVLQGLLGVAPEALRQDWEASAFADDGLSFNSSLVDRLVRYLDRLPGEGFTEKVESYARSCGISGEEIAAFRNLMLEEAR